MKKLTLVVIGVCALVGFAYAASELSSDNKTYSWRYKMTVEVETPEGIVTGSAVRQMGNEAKGVDLPDVGNPADVSGEAVVVDLGKRGVLFVLISHKSDLEFYYTFRKYFPHGGSTLEGSKFYASMPTGTKEVFDPEKPPGYPKLVTFTDMNDPKSVTLVQVWERQRSGLFSLKEDRFEELFGEGVKLKGITLEITDEPVTWGVVDKYLSWLKDLKGGCLHGGFTARGAPLGLYGGNFQRDLDKWEK
ncbi:MAG: hypothetical protein R3E13_11960 [Alphaproteobacteria bacterium]